MNGKQDYYNVGSRDSIVVSSSSLSSIDPRDGGSPQKFLSFFDEKKEEQLEARHTKLGNLIHKWGEDKESFYISSVDKPSEVMGLIADLVIKEIELNGVEFTRQLCFDVSKVLNYQPRWTDETRLKNVYDGVAAYIEDKLLADSEHKLYMTKSEAEVIESATNSVLKHPLAKGLLFMQDTDFSDCVNYKEQEIYWELKGLMFKAKIDDFTINHEKKLVIINDIKSMSSSVYAYKNFKYYRTYRQLAFYGRAVREFCMQNSINIADYTFIHHVIGIETFGLFQCAVWSVQQLWITRGIQEIRDLIERIKWHVDNDEWNYSMEEVNNNYMLEMPYEEDD